MCRTNGDSAIYIAIEQQPAHAATVISPGVLFNFFNFLHGFDSRCARQGSSIQAGNARVEARIPRLPGFAQLNHRVCYARVFFQNPNGIWSANALPFQGIPQ